MVGKEEAADAQEGEDWTKLALPVLFLRDVLNGLLGIGLRDGPLAEESIVEWVLNEWPSQFPKPAVGIIERRIAYLKKVGVVGRVANSECIALTEKGREVLEEAAALVKEGNDRRRAEGGELFKPGFEERWARPFLSS